MNKKQRSCDGRFAWRVYDPKKFCSVPFRASELALPRNSECLGMSTFFRGITETVPSLFRGIFSERNSVPNPKCGKVTLMKCSPPPQYCAHLLSLLCLPAPVLFLHSSAMCFPSSVVCFTLSVVCFSSSILC
jgi:hypothetical protein